MMASAIQVRQNWEEVVGAKRVDLEKLLPDHIRPRRWFGDKGRTIRWVRIIDAVRIPVGDSAAFYTLLETGFDKGSAETYALPIAFALDVSRACPPHAVIAAVEGGASGILYDATAAVDFCAALLDAVEHGRVFSGTKGQIRGTALTRFRALRGTDTLAPKVGNAEQSNTSILYGDRLIMKLFRKLEEGINPDVEISRYLTEELHFDHTAPMAGVLEYQRGGNAEPMTLAMVQGFIANRGDAWKFALELAERSAAQIRAEWWKQLDLQGGALLDIAEAGLPVAAAEQLGDVLNAARLLGERTSEMHLALAARSDDPNMMPEPLSLPFQESLCHGLEELAARVFRELGACLGKLPETARGAAERLLGRTAAVAERLRPMRARAFTGLRCRCHGDYHLGQVLYTGADFVIVDFEGEPARPLSERRRKQSPLKDVAGMIRSFDYAAHSARLPEEAARLWYTLASAAFLRAYRHSAVRGAFLPAERADLAVLLDFHLLEKAIYELGYEINHRPDWVPIPLQGIMRLLGVGS